MQVTVLSIIPVIVFAALTSAFANDAAEEQKESVIASGVLIRSLVRQKRACVEPNTFCKMRGEPCCKGGCKVTQWGQRCTSGYSPHWRGGEDGGEDRTACVGKDQSCDMGGTPCCKGSCSVTQWGQRCTSGYRPHWRGGEDGGEDRASCVGRDQSCDMGGTPCCKGSCSVTQWGQRCTSGHRPNWRCAKKQQK